MIDPVAMTIDLDDRITDPEEKKIDLEDKIDPVEKEIIAT